MKFELLSKPIVTHATIGKNMSSSMVEEFDKTRKQIGDVVDVMSNSFFAMTQHFHYAFYFHLPPDMLTEILCYSYLRVSRNQVNNDTDEGIMSGSVEDWLRAAIVFCRKETDKPLRGLFNLVCQVFEQDGIQLPFNKVDLGDMTFAIKQT